jgi:hypothetical protein
MKSIAVIVALLVPAAASASVVCPVNTASGTDWGIMAQANQLEAIIAAVPNTAPGTDWGIQAQAAIREQIRNQCR